MSLPCPSEHDLREFAVGAIDDDSFEAIALHIEDCEICQDLLAGMDCKDPLLLHLNELRLTQSLEDVDALRIRDWAENTIIPFVPTTSKGENAPTASMTLNELPEFFGNEYRIIERVGRGGMGVVYKAEHIYLKRLRAIKVLGDQRLYDEQFVQRFLREIAALASIEHRNVVTAIDARVSRDHLFLVMEFLEGTDAGKLSRRFGMLRVADACEVVRQAACGLHAIHDAGFFHRDIKPSNLFVQSNGIVKILDLGLAKLTSISTAEDELTNSGLVVGTLDYMAPEQAGSSISLDVRADLYSLGCTLFTLLAGRPPFSSNEFPTAADKVLAHRRTAPPRLKDLREDVPDVVATLVDKLLAKRPEDRLSSAKELAERLTEFCNGHQLDQLQVMSGVPDSETYSNAVPSTLRQNSPAGIFSLRKRIPRRLIGVAVTIVFVIGLIVLIAKVLQNPPASNMGVNTLLDAHPQGDLPADDRHTVVRELLFPQGDAFSTWEVLPSKDAIRVNCDSIALLALGDDPGAFSSLEAHIKQPGDNGGVGLFFNYHTEWLGARERVEFYCIGIRETDDGIHKLEFNRCRYWRYDPYSQSYTQIAWAPVVPHADGSNSLRIETGMDPSLYLGIYWNNEEIVWNVDLDNNTLGLENVATSECGIYATKASATFFDIIVNENRPVLTKSDLQKH